MSTDDGDIVAGMTDMVVYQNFRAMLGDIARTVCSKLCEGQMRPPMEPMSALMTLMVSFIWDTSCDNFSSVQTRIRIESIIGPPA